MLQPTKGRVLIHRLTSKLQRAHDALIIIPETVEEKPTNFAVVLASGKLVQSDLKAGEMVIVTDYSGAPTEVLMNDGSTVEAHIVVEDDILAVMEVLDA